MADDARDVVSVVPTGESRREELLRSALEVIAERGITDTRIADVADRAGTSPALVIYYFRTKDNLLTEAIRLAEDLWYELGAGRMDAAVGAAGRLQEILTTIFVPPGDGGLPSLWALWVDLWARSLRHPEVARVREEFDGRWRRAIADVVVDGQRSGGFGPTDPTEFAIALWALLDGLAVQIALGDPAIDCPLALRISMGFAARSLGFEWDPDGAGAVPVADG
ncbi:MAG: TetR family transcriptional regulator C-terminal domain-containing protein [Acidimicrobiales bacterium]